MSYISIPTTVEPIVNCIVCGSHQAQLYNLSDPLTGRAKYQCETGRLFYLDYTRQSENEDYKVVAGGYTL